MLKTTIGQIMIIRESFNSVAQLRTRTTLLFVEPWFDKKERITVRLAIVKSILFRFAAPPSLATSACYNGYTGNKYIHHVFWNHHSFVWGHKQKCFI